MTASELRAEGKSIDETAQYIEAHKQEVNQFATVESLNYLKRAGRVSTTSAVFGGLLQVKPIIISDADGQNVAVEKVKGRKNSLVRLADLFKETYRSNPHQRIWARSTGKSALMLRAFFDFPVIISWGNPHDFFKRFRKIAAA